MRRCTHNSPLTTHNSSFVPALRFPEFRNAGPWEVKRLREIADINPTCGPLPDRFIYIDLESVVDGRLIQKREISRSLAPSRAQRVIERGDILFQTVRPYQRNNLFCDYNDGNYVASTGYAQLRASQNARFLYQMLHTDSFVRAVLARCSGSNYPAINPSALSSIPVALPSKPEQQKIADCLSSLDELIQLQAQKLNALKAHKKGLMQQLFPREGETTPRLRFPEFRNAGPWEVKRLGEVSEVLDNMRKPVTSTARNPGPYPYYGASGIIDYIDEYIFDERLVLIGEDGAKWGPFESTAFIAEGRYWVNNHAHVLRALAVSDVLLVNYLNATDVSIYVTGAAPPKLTLDNLKLIRIPIPPLEEEQQKIADCLSSLDELIQLQAQKLNALKAHKKGLMQQLFPQEVSA